MKRPRSRSLTAPPAVTLSAITMLVAALALPVAAQSRNDFVKTRQTIQEIQRIGNAVTAWLTEQEAARPGAQRRGEPAEGEGTEVSIADFDPISRVDLTKLLVPKYIPALPEHDGWGNPYELYLNRDDLGGRRVVLIRSAGSDGRFDRQAYEPGAFAPEASAEDIVWTDGYLARWPRPGL